MIVQGKKVKVVENLGYQGGKHAKVVLVDGEERVITRFLGGPWEFHIPVVIPHERRTNNE